MKQTVNTRKDNAKHKRAELHMHSKMSDMDGVTSAAELIKQAFLWGHKAVAITDLGNVQAYPEMMRAAEKIKNNGGEIKVIYGMEAYVVNDIGSSDDIKDLPVYHASILVKSRGGIKKLYKLVSLSHMEYYRKVPRIPLSELQKYRKWFLIGSGCTEGELYRALLDIRTQKEIDEIAEMYDYFEITPDGNNEINKKIVEFADKYGKLCVAVGDVRFKDKEDEIAHKIIRSAWKKNTKDQPPMFFRTTDEMLGEFDYLGAEKAFKVTVANTNKIADMIDANIRPLPQGKFYPYIPNSDNELREICNNKAHELYGDELPEIVENRLKKELDAIISEDFSAHFMTAQKLVKYSEENGYHVITRGSVGASLAAFLAGISEVDPLPPHYCCPKCRHSEFITDGSVASGFDLHEKECPECRTFMKRDGQDIPFETFMGFDGKKAPEIALNFSGEIRDKAISYAEEMFGKERVFKGGVISAVKEKTAVNLVTDYCEKHGVTYTIGEINDIAERCIGVKKSMGWYPGCLIIIPEICDVFDFTPVQFRELSDDELITHFDFHAFGDMLLKIDLIGSDTPTLYKRLDDTTGVSGVKTSEVPMTNDLFARSAYKLFTSAEVLHLDFDTGESCGTLGIPEFGTDFVMKMLTETQPKTFSDLVKISALAHGTGTWNDNARDLIKNGTCTLSEVIATRDDVMLYLTRKGIEPRLAFRIMEIVSNGKAEELFDDEIYRAFREHNVPQWYIKSCEKIEYLFPKAHAAALATAAVKLAVLKVYYPVEFYAAVLADRISTVKSDIIVNGKEAVIKRLKALSKKESSGEISPWEYGEIDALRIFLEAIAQGVIREVIEKLKEMGALKNYSR